MKEVHNKKSLPIENCDMCDYVGIWPNLIKHQKWNMLDQTRFFAVRNGCDKLLYTYIDYENNLYMDK